MIDRTRQFRVGLLVLACGVTFVTLLAFIAGSALQRDVSEYRILFDENVKGMVVGSKVNFQGVPIGSVSDIRFQAGRTLVLIHVDPGRAVIQEVTRARLDRLLVTGQVTIELEGYEDGAAVLPAGDVITAASTDPITELKTSLPALLDEVHGVLGQTTDVLSRVARALSDENLGHFERILANIERATEVLPGELRATSAEARATLAAFRPLAADARASLDRVAGVAERTGAELGETLEAGRAAIADVGRTLDRFAATADGLARLVAEAEGLLGHNRNALRTMLVGAADAVRELQALARQLRAAPNCVLFGADQPEIDVPATPPRGGDR